MTLVATRAPSPSQDSASSDEHELLSRLRAGDPAAYERLVRELSPRLLAVARRLMGNEHDAADALQDAFVSAFNALGDFDGRSKLSTWLHRIVVNACLMKLRKARRRSERDITPLLPVFLDDGHQAAPSRAWDHGAPGNAQRADARELVLRKIHELPEAYRTVLLLRDIEELDTKETAQRLGESENAVKTRLHRARQALRTLLEPLMTGGSL